MAFFDELSKNISDSSKISKINSLISDENERRNSLYLEIGKAYFELHKDDCEPRFEAQVAELKEIGKRVDDYNQQIKKIKGIFPCPNCGRDLSKTDVFCTGCGTRVVAPQPAGTVCSKCGASLAPGSAFCTTCGTKVEAAAPVAPVPQTFVCTVCGAQLAAGSAFCTKCGTKTAPAAPAPAAPAPAPAPAAPAPVAGNESSASFGQESYGEFCTNCGKQLPPDSKFCIYCGNRQG